MTEKIIQKALFKNFQSHPYKFTNAYYFNNESDWLSFLPSGFCYEAEIKISRSDFKADFKKEKHVVHGSNSSGTGTFLRKTRDVTDFNPSWDFCRDFPELVIATEEHRYEYVNRGRGDSERVLNLKIELRSMVSSQIEFVPTKKTMLPNKFFYAVPTGLISKEEVPEYAGLLYIDENLNVIKIKDGKFLHKEKHDPVKLFKKTYYVYEKELFKNLNK